MHRSVLLVPLVPVLLLNETSYWTLLALTSAVCVAGISMAKAASLRQVGSRCAPVILGVAAMVLLLVLQLVPLAPLALTYPIWKNAADALGTDIGNTISLDPGITVQGMLHLLFLATAILAIAGVSIDRNRARIVYRLVALGTFLLCVFLLGYQHLNGTKFAWNTALNATGPVALIIGTSLILRRRDDMGNELIDVAVGASTTILSVIVLTIQHSTPIILLALGGTCLMVASCWLPGSKFNRHLPLALAALLTALLAATSFSSRWPPVFSEAMRTDNTVTPDAVKRMLSDTPPMGTGAGTFSSLARIYNSNAGDGVLPPTLVTKFALEFGPIGTLALAFFWVVLALELLTGAFRRNRDRYFCASAAAVACIGAIESFLDAGWSESPIQALVAMLIALGLAQRDSSLY